MARRSKATIEAQRAASWAFNVTHNFAGWRVCRCGRFAYCAGRTYETQRCRTCHMTGATSRRQNEAA